MLLKCYTQCVSKFGKLSRGHKTENKSVFILIPKKCNAKECPNYPRNRTHFTCKQSESESCSVVSDSLRPQGLFSPWNSPGHNTQVGSFSLLQVIFPTQGTNPGFPHYRWTLYQLRHKGSQRKLEWVAYHRLQQIILNQELNWGLLHCRRILYQLSYQGR